MRMLYKEGLTDSFLKRYLMLAKKNGVTKEESAGIITHAAFYAGWHVCRKNLFSANLLLQQ